MYYSRRCPTREHCTESTNLRCNSQVDAAAALLAHALGSFCDVAPNSRRPKLSPTQAMRRQKTKCETVCAARNLNKAYITQDAKALNSYHHKVHSGLKGLLCEAILHEAILYGLAFGTKNLTITTMVVSASFRASSGSDFQLHNGDSSSITWVIVMGSHSSSRSSPVRKPTSSVSAR